MAQFRMGNCWRGLALLRLAEATHRQDIGVEATLEPEQHCAGIRHMQPS